MREMIVIIRANGAPVLAIDPLDVLTTVDGLVVPTDAGVLRILDTIIEIETVSPAAPTLSLVWSDDRTPVRFCCPVCDDVCVVDDDGAIAGTEHLVCMGCDGDDD